MTPIELKAYNKEYYQKNKERITKQIQEYAEKHKVKIKKQKQEYYRIHKVKIKKQRQEYAEKHKAIIIEYGKEYRNSHKSERNEYVSNRRKNDSLFKLTADIRSLVLTAFKRKGYKKNSKTENILGCSFEELKQHLESKFTKGMTWENHGEWHIDHIIPMVTANTEAEVLKLNHFTNLQPLWATTEIAEKHGEIGYIGNLEKGDNII